MPITNGTRHRFMLIPSRRSTLVAIRTPQEVQHQNRRSITLAAVINQVHDRRAVACRFIATHDRGHGPGNFTPSPDGGWGALTPAKGTRINNLATPQSGTQRRAKLGE